MKWKEICEYVKKQDETMPEYLWETSMATAVIRHKNGKRYEVLRKVEKFRLG